MRPALLALTLTCAATAAAQSPGWPAVQSLAPGTPIKVRADHNSSTCTVASVTDTALLCTRSTGQLSYPRPEVRTIRLSAHGRSAGSGALIGAGAGAAIGAGTGAAVNSGDKGSLAHVSSGKATGIGAAAGILIGALTGAAIGSASGFAGHVIYRR